MIDTQCACNSAWWRNARERARAGGVFRAGRRQHAKTKARSRWRGCWLSFRRSMLRQQLKTDPVATQQHCEFCFDALIAHLQGDPAPEPLFEDALWCVDPWAAWTLSAALTRPGSSAVLRCGAGGGGSDAARMACACLGRCPCIMQPASQGSRPAECLLCLLLPCALQPCHRVDSLGCNIRCKFSTASMSMPFALYGRAHPSALFAASLMASLLCRTRLALSDTPGLCSRTAYLQPPFRDLEQALQQCWWRPQPAWLHWNLGAAPHAHGTQGLCTHQACIMGGVRALTRSVCSQQLQA